MSAETGGGNGRGRGTGAHGEPIREMVCISCPVGCRLSLYLEPTEAGAGEAADRLVVTGNRCSRGETYAREEYLAPKRIVTATARIRSARRSRLPVRTDAPLPKEQIEGLLSQIYELELDPPVARGQVIFSDIGGSGVDLVASFSVKE